MLVLSRKSGERIHIGNNIVIEVRRVTGNRVTLALDAPRDVRILRGELQAAATEFEIALDETPAATSESSYQVSHQRLQIPNRPAAPSMLRNLVG